MTDRKTEVRDLLRLTPEEVIERAGDRLVVCEDIEALHRRLADDLFDEIRERNARGEPTRLIVPVGPTGQYPFLADRINREGLSLADCWFFFMDEYRGEDGKAVPADHPLSFKGEAERLFLGRLDPACGLDRERVVVPDETNVDSLAAKIESVGGLDTCYGGIGIHGHVAFNEPEPGIKDSGPRLVELNDFTVTINAVRSHVGGSLETFPRHAYTLGMKQILGARRTRLYCRNGCEFDWANTVLRLALFGEPGDDYPVTYIRDHDYRITTDRETLATPRHTI
jgi:glucosamine-6-phosphate deaminase